MMLEKAGQPKVSKKVDVIPEVFWEWIADYVRQESKIEEVFPMPHALMRRESHLIDYLSHYHIGTEPTWHTGTNSTIRIRLFTTHRDFRRYTPDIQHHPHVTFLSLLRI
jgi:hypothetical protein